MAEPLLRVENITAGYHGQHVLRDVTLSVESGDVVTIIGPNGHGKTTLLRTISGLVRPTQGEIWLDGKSLRGLKVSSIVELGIVHVPQGDLIFPDMTVRDNLLMGAYLPAANAEAGKRLQEIFELLPVLEERQGQVARTLSGGERRMLGIGRGLMTGGRILMLDEPSLGLAPIVMDQVYSVIVNLKEEGHTILLVEENISRVSEFSDTIYLLDSGRFVWEGAPDDLRLHQEVLETYLGG